MCPNILPARPIEKSGVEVILIKCLTGSMLRIRPIYVPPLHAGVGRVDTSDKPDVREDDFERFLAHIEYYGSLF